jgi:hypothetical protein
MTVSKFYSFDNHSSWSTAAAVAHGGFRSNRRGPRRWKTAAVVSPWWQEAALQPPWATAVACGQPPWATTVTFLYIKERKHTFAMACTVLGP